MLIWWASVAFSASLSARQAGPAIDLGAGLGWSGAPVAIAGTASLGAWFGRYDDDFAIGRHGWLGVTGRLRARQGLVEVAPMLELRRGIDLLVVGVQGFIAGGLVLDVAGSEDARPLGFTAMIGFILRYRRTRHTSLILRIGGGVDVVERRVNPTLGFTIGVGWARPSSFNGGRG